jgi:hypothetical protein
MPGYRVVDVMKQSLLAYMFDSLCVQKATQRVPAGGIGRVTILEKKAVRPAEAMPQSGRGIEK